MTETPHRVFALALLSARPTGDARSHDPVQQRDCSRSGALIDRDMPEALTVAVTKPKADAGEA
ncbi:MAG: hypothetical protein M3P44_11855, partial [Actinomycetota bacterium]|nr:hypothetical protein [Actinomycetota bacterium]